MYTMKEYLEMDNSMAFNIAIYNRFATPGDGYADICGSFIDGVMQWAYHHIRYVDEKTNSKYHGWIITFEDDPSRPYAKTEGKVYIPNWVMDITPKNWKHAKCLFNKYLIKHE